MPLQNVCEKSYRSQGVSVVRGYRFFRTAYHRYQRLSHQTRPRDDQPYLLVLLSPDDMSAPLLRKTCNPYSVPSRSTRAGSEAIAMCTCKITASIKIIRSFHRMRIKKPPTSLRTK